MRVPALLIMFSGRSLIVTFLRNVGLYGRSRGNEDGRISCDAERLQRWNCAPDARSYFPSSASAIGLLGLLRWRLDSQRNEISRIQPFIHLATNGHTARGVVARPAAKIVYLSTRTLSSPCLRAGARRSDGWGDNKPANRQF